MKIPIFKNFIISAFLANASAQTYSVFQPSCYPTTIGDRVWVYAGMYGSNSDDVWFTVTSEQAGSWIQMNNFCVTSQTVQGTGMARIMNSHEMQMSYEIGYNYWGGVWSDIWLAGQYVAGNWLWSVGGGTSTTAMSYTHRSYRTTDKICGK